MFSCSAELHIVHRVILRDFGESHGLAVVRLDVPNWLQRFWESLVTFIIAFTAVFQMAKEPLSVFNRGLGLLFSTGYKSR